MQKAQGREAEAQKNQDIARKLFPQKADYYENEQVKTLVVGPLKD